jgi:LPS-assembly protein
VLGPTPFLWFVLFLIVCSSAVPCPGASSSPLSDLQDPQEPWHILADEVRHDRQADLYMASGNVVIQRGDVRIAADTIRFDHKKMQALAEGHVMISSGKDLITARSADLDLANETGVVIDGSLFASENHFYFRGDRIEKVGPDSYTADRATVTTCDGDRPDWKITGRDLSITIEGYGTVRNATLWAGPVPVFYSPWLGFPVKIKRQSGFLPPQFGVSDRKGFEYLQPFYWAIDESADATFYGHTMSKRGLRLGAEYRYILDERSRGTAMADGFSDRKVDDGTPGSEKWGYGGDDYLRSHSDRYWFRMKQDQALPADFTAKLDLDIVSDQDYLQEFKTGYTGFERTRAEFLDTFGRDIDEFTDTTRVNRLNLNRIWSSYSLNAEARWYDNVVKRRYEETDDTLQKLPFVTFTGSRQPLLSSPAYFDFETEYVRFYRRDGDRGNRLDLYPRFYLPWRYGRFATVEPSVGLRETAWAIDHEESGQPDKDPYAHRESYDFKLDMTSEVYRVFETDWGEIERIQHLLRPQIVYEYIPDQDQSSFPEFDEKDRIEKRNLVTYSLTNTLISRSPAGEDADPRYRDFLRFKLLQQYDINEANVENDPRPFSPISAELELTPADPVSLKADAQWSVYDAAFVGHNISGQLQDGRGDQLSFEYRYVRDSEESIIVNARVKATGTVSLTGVFEENLFDDENLKTGVGILYESQCWAVDLTYLEEGDDKSINFMVRLTGLGALGAGLGVGGE